MIKKGYMLFIVSNQSGIGRGYYKEEDNREVDKYIVNTLKRHGIKITKSYYAPYYSKSKIPKYREGKEFRKPESGLLVKAAEEFNIDISKSVIIGDKHSDIGAGKKAGCGTIMVLTGYGMQESRKPDGIKPGHCCRDLKYTLKYL